jgi:hypothetical protein
VVIRAHHIRSYLSLAPRGEESDMSTGENHGPERYEIRVRGHLESRWAMWFGGMALIHGTDGTTTISGPVVDQAALHGLLSTVRDTGLPLVSVTPVPPQPHDQTRPADPRKDAT